MLEFAAYLMIGGSVIGLLVLLWFAFQYHFNNDMSAKNNFLNLAPALAIFMVVTVILCASLGIMENKQMERQVELENIQKDSIVKALILKIDSINRNK